MAVYCGIDLHSTNSYVVVLDEEDQPLFQHRLANDLELICRALRPFGDELVGVVVESTYNWYWLVDGLMAADFRVHLANPAAIKQYEGLKHSDDRSDAAWLARMLRLGILPEGYIYPAALRGTRDLLRRRGQLVRQRTANLLAIQNQVARSRGLRLSANRIKRLAPGELAELLGAQEQDDLVLAVGSNLAILQALSREIRALERAVLKRARLEPAFCYLCTVTGIGRILGLTIMLETGDIGRFAGPGQFASYSRCVESKRLSNGKRKGAGNAKCGNKYLAWAFVEAAHFAIGRSPQVRRFYERKKAKRGEFVALKAVARKLARACYYVMRDQVPFEEERCFT